MGSKVSELLAEFEQMGVFDSVMDETPIATESAPAPTMPESSASPTVVLKPLRTEDGKSESVTLVQALVQLSSVAVEMQRACVQQAKLAGEFRDILARMVGMVRGTESVEVPEPATEQVEPSNPQKSAVKARSSVSDLEEIKRKRVERMRERAERHRQRLAAGLDPIDETEEVSSIEDEDTEPPMTEMAENPADLVEEATKSVRADIDASRQGSNRSIPDVDFDVASILGGSED